MRSLRSLLVVLVSSVSVAFGPDTRAQDAPLEAFLLETCPTEIPPAKKVASFPVGALILEPLLSQLISGTLDAAGAYLASAATAKSARMSALQQDDFYKLNARGELSTAESACLIVVSPGSSKPVPTWLKVAKTRADQLIPLSASPRFYFEAKILADQTPGVSKMNIAPNFLHIGEFLADGWSYRDVRKYSVAATFRSRLSGEVFGSFKFDFNDLPLSTWGTTQTIAAGVIDKSITPQLSLMAGPVQVPFYPVAGAVSAAALAQQQAAAPYLEADALLSGKVAPVRRLPDWEVRPKVAPNAPAETQNYQAALEALCNSIDAINGKAKEGKGTLSDARCPVTHLGYANQAEDTRKALERKLAHDWAVEFANFHLGETPETCAKSGSKIACKPPAPKRAALGPYMIELAVVETREPTEFAKALAATFAANKDKLKTAIEDRALPSRREAAEQSAEDAAQKAKVAFELAKLEVEKAEAKLQEAASEPRSLQISLQAEVLKARVAANAAAKTAGISQPPYAY